MVRPSEREIFFCLKVVKLIEINKTEKAIVSKKKIFQLD
jgi:hypothetical protein